MYNDTLRRRYSKYMTFLEAHRIVHDFGGRVAKERKSMFIPSSWINYSEQELIDAFVIFWTYGALANKDK